MARWGQRSVKWCMAWIRRIYPASLRTLELKMKLLSSRFSTINLWNSVPQDMVLATSTMALKGDEILFHGGEEEDSIALDTSCWAAAFMATILVWLPRSTRLATAVIRTSVDLLGSSLAGLCFGFCDV